MKKNFPRVKDETQQQHQKLKIYVTRTKFCQDQTDASQFPSYSCLQPGPSRGGANRLAGPE